MFYFVFNYNVLIFFQTELEKFIHIPTEESFHELSDIGSESILGHKRSAYRAEYHVASRLLRRLVQIHVYFVIFFNMVV